MSKSVKVSISAYFNIPDDATPIYNGYIELADGRLLCPFIGMLNPTVDAIEGTELGMVRRWNVELTEYSEVVVELIDEPCPET